MYIIRFPLNSSRSNALITSYMSVKCQSHFSKHSTFHIIFIQTKLHQLHHVLTFASSTSGFRYQLITFPPKLIN